MADGSWSYSEEKSKGWVDNFHTGYNLNSLKIYIEATGDKIYENNLEKGFEYYKNNFIDSNGRPKYYNNRVYPVDSQCAGQLLETLANLSNMDNSSIELSKKVANWWINNMQDNDGHYYYRQYPMNIKAKTPMLHWAQATVYKGMTSLYKKL